MQIISSLHEDRLLLGSLLVKDKNNVEVISTDCLGLSDDNYAASFNNSTKDPLKRGGNTPYGIYKAAVNLFSKPTEQDIHSFGPYGFLLLKAISGDALIACGPMDLRTGDGDRSGICLHSGVLNPLYTAWHGLRPTHGCCRTIDNAMFLIFKAIKNTEDTDINVSVVKF